MATTETEDESVYIGFDTEYQRVGDKNFILSAQIFGICQNQTWQAIKFLSDKRMTFEEVVKWAVEEGIRGRVLKRRPAKIYLCAHYSIADMSTLRERERTFRQIDYCKKTFVTIREPIRVRYHDENRNKHEIEVVLRDPWLMAPAGKRKLEVIGKYVELEKIDVHPYGKDEMGRLLRENQELFIKYAIADAQIAAVYTREMARFANEFFGSSEAPATIGGCAVKLALQSWKKEKIDRHTVLGTKRVKREKGRFDIVPLPIRQDYENFAKNAFAGGRNETYCFGPSPERDFVDLDLAGAYVSALATLGLPQWDRLRSTCNLDDFQPDVIGFGFVRFKFPPSTRFPCMPVRTETSLIFPLQGECYATAPEILLARKLGAEIEVRRGCVMPMDFGCRPFVAISKEVALAREKFKAQSGTGSLMEQLVKTVGNCVFGKLAQAIRPKRVFSTRLMDMEEMKESPLTNPYLAAYVTGFIRSVLGEVLAAVPKECLVISATTDGFLSDVPESFINQLTAGPLCRMYAAARALVAADQQVLEPKHRARQVMSWRTRGLATLDHDPEEELMLARAGIRTPQGSLEEQNEFIVTKFVVASMEKHLPAYVSAMPGNSASTAVTSCRKSRSFGIGWTMTSSGCRLGSESGRSMASRTSASILSPCRTQRSLDDCVIAGRISTSDFNSRSSANTTFAISKSSSPSRNRENYNCRRKARLCT